MTPSDFDQWQSQIADIIATVLREYRGNIDDELEQFAVDCHPWNGVIALALLTHEELESTPFLSEPGEMAAWKHYNCGSSLPVSQRITALALQMRTAYESAEINRASVANQFFRRCALAVAAQPVQDALSTYRLSVRFKITIPHPDSNEDFFPPS